MRRIRHREILAVGLVLIALSVVRAGEDPNAKKNKSAEVKPDKIEWLRFDKALQKAREENKHLFVDFTATWCGWCKRLEKDTFSKPEVIELLNKDFVSTKVWDHKEDTLDIDGYKIPEKFLARTQFGVRTYPTLWFISPDGQKIGPISGYVNAQQFMRALNYVRDYQYLVASRDEDTEKDNTED